MTLLSCCFLILNVRPSSHHITWLLQLLPSHPHPSQWEGEKGERKVIFIHFMVTTSSCKYHFYSHSIVRKSVTWPHLTREGWAMYFSADQVYNQLKMPLLCQKGWMVWCLQQDRVSLCAQPLGIVLKGREYLLFQPSLLPVAGIL